MPKILNDIKQLLHNKLLYYVMFSTLLINFLLYHNNFFHPHTFWIFYSTIIMFVLPIYFYIIVEEEKKNLRIIYSILFSIIGFIIVYMMYNRELRKEFYDITKIILFIIITIIPIIVYMIIKKNFFIRNLGINVKNFKLSFLLTISAIIIMIPIIIIASGYSNFHKIYPLFKVMKNGGFTFIKYEVLFLLFFIFWEFLFRGFMLFAFAKHTNIKIAIFLQAIIFTFAHYGKPEIETISSFFGGILLGIIIYRLKNIFPAAIIHFSIALTMDIMAVFF